MSRRSRRKQNAAQSSWLGKALLALGVLLILAVFGGYAGLRSYLHSAGFREFLSAETGAGLGVVGKFEPFSWDGLAVKTGGFSGEGEGVVSSIKASKLETEIGFGGFSRGVWEVKQTRVGSLELVISPEKAEEPRPRDPHRRENAVEEKQAGWLPTEVELETVEVGRIDVVVETEGGPITAKGMSLDLASAGGKGAYEIELIGGTVDTPQEMIPRIDVEKLGGTWRDGRFYLNEADVRLFNEGVLTATGEFDSIVDTLVVEGKLDGVKCEEIFNETWAKRVTGDVESSFVIDNRSGSEKVSGELVIENATATALPMMDALAAYADTRKFRSLRLDEARTDWVYTKDEIELSNMVFSSDGLIRLEGNLRIKGRAMDGEFLLGLVPGTLADIPGAERDVFKPGSHGLLWAPVRISGTLDDIEEDLTMRLVEAAGMRMLTKLPENGELALKFAEKALEEEPAKLIEKGVQILKESEKVQEVGEKAVREVGGLLKGVLGR